MRIGFMLGLAVVFGLVLLYAQATPGEGEKTYVDKCAPCHARDGSGDTARGRTMKVPDLRSAEIQKKTDSQLMEAIVKGKIHATVNKEVADERLLKVVLFLRTLKPAAKK